MTDTLDIDEAAALLKVNAETVRQMASGGTLLGARVGRAWVFLREDLLTYLRDEIRAQTRRRRDAQPETTGRAFKAPPSLT